VPDPDPGGSNDVGPSWEVDESPGGFDDDPEPLRRPVWWRWVAIAVVVAMVVATPAAYALYLLLR
jgi:hypothetical protein